MVIAQVEERLIDGEVRTVEVHEDGTEKLATKVAGSHKVEELSNVYDAISGSAAEIEDAVNNASAGDVIGIGGAGPYDLSTLLDVPADNVTIVGMHEAASQLRRSGDIIRSQGKTGLHLENLRLNGKGGNNDLIRIENGSKNFTSDHILQDVTCLNTTGNGLYVENVHDSEFRNLLCFECGDSANSTANLKVNANSTDYARGNTFESCRFEAHLGSGTRDGPQADVTNLRYSDFIGCKFHAESGQTTPMFQTASNHGLKLWGGFFATLGETLDAINDTTSAPAGYFGVTIRDAVDTAFRITSNKRIIGCQMGPSTRAITGEFGGFLDNNILVANNLGGPTVGIETRGGAVDNTIMANVYTGTGTGIEENNPGNNHIEGNVPPFYQADSTVAVASGGTASVNLIGGQQGDVLDVEAMPANDPGNDHGYTVDKVWFDDSANFIKAQISETEAAGGGDARVVAKIKP